MSKQSSGGIGFGAAIAGIISWVHWHSVGWCIFHILCGWFYILYYIIRYGFR